MLTDPARWAGLKALFDALADLPAAAREAPMAAAALDAEALAELRSLLAHHDAAATGTGFLAVTAAERLHDPAQRVGQRLGAWQIVRAVGSGGMGDVFEARRADGSFEARAAVKLLKRGMDSAAVLARFAQERQALARLAHPHIARLLDAGASPEGLPYFVMEFVEGRPIHEAALGRPLEERLGLFLQLAEAVAHAHRNLLVHRDLKPGNVLVDGDGQVKLLDFGIAKALDPLESAEGDTTGLGARPYTPHHASPEQVRGEPVSTATDIYSLGVLLYQMLTGTRPTGRRATTAAEAVKGVLEEQPTRPSRLSDAEAQDPQWLATRRRLEGDLDNILLKALEKVPAQRYPSVDAMAADVRAFLDGRPVGARAAGALYVAGKFIQRNRWAVAATALGSVGAIAGLAATVLQGRAAAALGVLGLAGGLALALVQGLRAARAGDDARQRLADTKAVLRTLVTQHADAITHLPGGLSVKEAMLDDAIRILDRLALSARDDAEITATLADGYVRLAQLQGNGQGVSLGKDVQAEAHARKALEAYARVDAAGSRDPQRPLGLSQAHTVLARVSAARGELTDALAHFQRGAEVLTGALASHAAHVALRRRLAATQADIGQLHDCTGAPSLDQPEAALRWLDHAAKGYADLLAETRSADDRRQLALVEGARAVVFQKQDRLAEAVDCLARAVDGVTAAASGTAGNDTHDELALALTLNNLGFLHLRLGDAAQAVPRLAQAHAIVERLRALEPGNPNWTLRRALIGQGHAAALREAGGAAEALTLLQAFEPVWLEQVAKAPSDAARAPMQRRLAMNRCSQAACLVDLGRAADALPLAQAAEAQMALQAAAEPPDRDRLLYHAETLAVLARADAAQRAAWIARATAVYDRAGALRPLTHDHARARQALG